MGSSKTILSAGLALMIAGAAQAGPIVNVGASDGDLYDTASLTGFQTDGSLMDGMEVTTCFDSQICETVVFDGTVGPSSYGEAVGSDWSLIADGDTFSNPFTFTSAVDNQIGGVISILLNGRPGNTIFDIIDTPFLSPGSARGKPFELYGDTSDLGDRNIDVEYSDKLAVGGTFYGDLYTVMKIDFGDVSFAGTFSFLADTDNNDFEGGSPIVPVTPGPSPVPEPGTLALLSAGLLGLAMRRRRNGV